MRHELMKPSGDVRWHAPVWVRAENAGADPVRTPGEALEKLDHRWPPHGGRHYRSARACCLAALRKQMEPDLAREAFVWASAEAQILDRSH
jgi:hypothetical protein